MKLSELFSSSTKTAVLETLTQHGGELHLRRIAELSEQSLTAVNAALKILKKEHIIQSKQRRQKVFFSIDWKTKESSLIKAVIDAKERALLSEVHESYPRRLSKSLSFTDEVHKMRNKVSTKFSSYRVFRDIIKILSNFDSPIILTKDIATNIYRAELKTVRFIELSLKINSDKEKKRIKASLYKFFPTSKFIRSSSEEIIKIFPKKEQFCPVEVFITFSSNESLTSSFVFENSKLEVSRVEDLIIERAISYVDNPDKLELVDDLQNIFEAKHLLNLPYIISELSKNHIPLHHAVFHLIPPVLKRVSREIEKEFGPFPEFQIHM